MDLSFLVPVMEMMAGKYGWVAQAIGIMGVARLVMKPIMLALPEIVKATPGEGDDKLLDKVMNHAIYKYVVLAMDFMLSVKLPKVEKPKE